MPSGRCKGYTVLVYSRNVHSDVAVFSMMLNQMVMFLYIYTTIITQFKVWSI